MKDWSKQTVVNLKAELKRRGLGQSGLKQELVTRLTEDDAAAAANDANEVPESEPAESSDPQPTESAESTADPAAIDATPKVVPSTEPEPAAADAVQPAPDAKDEPTTASAELDKKDAPSTAPEPAASADPTPPAPAEIAQDAQKRKRRSESPVVSSEAASRKRFLAYQDEAISPEPSGVTGVISKIKEGLEENTSLVDDIAKDAKDISDDLSKSAEQGQPPMIEESAEDVAMTTNEEEVNETAREVSPVSAPAPGPESHGVVDDRASRDDSDQAKDRQGTPEQAQQPTSQDVGDTMEYERDVQPAVHPATRALYIKNFMRPLRENAVQDHLLKLATPAGAETNNDDIEVFHLDQIRTHAFVVFRTTTQASRVRNNLHDVIWPDERERKPLWVDFVPPEKVQGWIDEESHGSRRRGARWEVLYDREDDGFVVARLDSGTAPPPALSAREPTRPVPSGPAVKDVNNIPLGPRSGRGADGVPLGPRGDPPRGPGHRTPRQIQGFPGGPVQTTQADPPISYQPVSEDLASRRIRNMRSFYTQDLKRDMGPENEINRYTFEQGDSFVDRGQEVFVGIRPPHREANRRRQMGAGGPPPRGPPPSSRGRRGNNRRGPRPLSDRYLPGINESGPYRQGDRGNFGSRFDDRRSRPDDRDRRH